MSLRVRSAHLFHKGHYNVIARQFRNRLASIVEDKQLTREFKQIEVLALASLATDLASRFDDDNELFDPIWFVNACTPKPFADFNEMLRFTWDSHQN